MVTGSLQRSMYFQTSKSDAIANLLKAWLLGTLDEKIINRLLDRYAADNPVIDFPPLFHLLRQVNES